jgi:hypothetical protein
MCSPTDASLPPSRTAARGLGADADRYSVITTWHVCELVAREPGDPTSGQSRERVLVCIGMMYRRGKSDSVILAEKPTNKAGRPAAESVEYYGITGNCRRIRWYAYQVGRLWRKWLLGANRRSRFQWSRFAALLKHHPLQAARIVHRYSAASEARP